MTLDHKLKWEEHVRLRSNLGLGLLAQVGCVLGSSWRASPKIIDWAYMSLILHALEYGYIVWVSTLHRVLIAALLAGIHRLACCMVTSAIEALLSFPPLPLYMRGQALLVKHCL